jgi:hypothetical protein
MSGLGIALLFEDLLAMTNSEIPTPKLHAVFTLESEDLQAR